MIGKYITKPYGVFRSSVYFLESIPFTLISRLVAHPDLAPPTPEQLDALKKHVLKMHQLEAENVEQGQYSWRILDFEMPWQHLRSLTEVWSDGLRVAWRMRNNKSKDFSADAAEIAKQKPDYYARNFHFQTDGYLSESSARRYDHQVEILFSGTAGAMRRMILPKLREVAQDRKMNWLEVGCGPGSATRYVVRTFPQAHVTALDMSEAYLKTAQDNLRSDRNVDFVQGDGAQLQFKDESFDAVYSVFMLHEMPRETRDQVFRECWRVLKPGGLLLFADSLQWDDEPELNWALERFPKAYHEPFYKGYIQDPLTDMYRRNLQVDATTENAFLTKIAWAYKPSNSALA